MSHHRPPIRALFIDLSGTLHIGSTPTPNAVRALERLRKARIPFRLTSNTSKESTTDLLSRLHGMGFDVRKEELWTSLGALKDEVTRRGLKKYEVCDLLDSQYRLYLCELCERFYNWDLLYSNMTYILFWPDRTACCQNLQCKNFQSSSIPVTTLASQ